VKNSLRSREKTLAHREEVLQQALALPPADRAFVAAALEQSLGVLVPDAIDGESGDACAGADFLKELQRRSAAFRSGQTSARPVQDVLADLRRRQAGETPCPNL
jgi:hypothetical protein